MIGRPDLVDAVENRFEIIEPLGEDDRLPRHVVGLDEIDHLAALIVDAEKREADAVEAGVADHLQLFLVRPFLAVRTAPLHAPPQTGRQEISA